MESLAETGVAQIRGSGRNLTLYLNVDGVDEMSLAEKRDPPENRVFSPHQIASTPSTNEISQPETLAPQGIE